MIDTHTQLLSIAAVTVASLTLINRKRLFRTVVTLLGVTALTFSNALPVMASPSSAAFDLGDNPQLQDQENLKFEEDIYLSNSGGQCFGLCLAQEQSESQSDTAILQAISSRVSEKDDLKVRVDNGAVFLFGTVKDEETAHKTIKQVESVPGVHAITVDLALVNRSKPAIG